MSRFSRLTRAPRFLARNIELSALAVVCLIAAGIWAFFALADQVLEGDTHAFDRAVLLALRNPADTEDPLGPLWIEELGRDFTALGGVGVLTLMTLAAGGFLFLVGHRRTMILLFVSVGGGILVSSLAKVFFDRPRPTLVPYETEVYTASFPSGHSMMAAVAYLTLGGLLARVQPRRSAKIYILVLAMLLAVAVGISRIYLGVHWPTDVLAGWAAGAAWAVGCMGLAQLLSRRGQIEAAPEETV